MPAALQPLSKRRAAPRRAATITRRAVPITRHAAPRLAAARPSAALPLNKGQQSRAAILDSALALASHHGLEGLSIGAVAEAAGMSKSGVFAHFGAREELQISVIREYFSRFEAQVFQPAMSAPRGLARLRALFANWLQWISVEIQSGCIFISGAVEFDDRPGPVRDALVESVKVWLGALHRAAAQAVQAGELRAGLDAQQVVFELHGLILALHFDARFLRRADAMAHAQTAFEQIVQNHSQPLSPKE